MRRNRGITCRSGESRTRDMTGGNSEHIRVSAFQNHYRETDASDLEPADNVLRSVSVRGAGFWRHGELIVPPLKCKTHDPENFIHIKRFHQHVIAATAQNLGPKRIISVTRGHNHGRRARQQLHMAQQVPPRSVHLLALADHEWNSNVM